MSEQGPADHELGDEADGAEEPAADDFSVPMWVWTVLAFVLLMAVVIVVIIRGGAKQDEPVAPVAPDPDAAAVTRPVEQAVTQPE